MRRGGGVAFRLFDPSHNLDVFADNHRLRLFYGAGLRQRVQRLGDLRIGECLAFIQRRLEFRRTIRPSMQHPHCDAKRRGGRRRP